MSRVDEHEPDLGKHNNANPGSRARRKWFCRARDKALSIALRRARDDVVQERTEEEVEEESKGTAL